jgi:hypothetical protein
MPARPWLLHFPDADQTVVEPQPSLPELGDELIAGWVVTEASPPRSDHVARYGLEVWLARKKRPRSTVRQRTDRST